MTQHVFDNGYSLSEEIVGILRERILKGDYSIGERLKENQISQELAVSRTPVREAFKQLEAEGLIEIYPNRGSFVQGFTRQDIKDIYAVRGAVEALAIRWAVRRITDEDITRLLEELELMEFYTKKKNGRKVLELNRQFHEILYNASGSRFMAQVLKSYQNYVQETRKATVYCEENLDGIFEEHKAIFRAVKERDEEEAAELIVVHLQNSQKRAEVSMKTKK